MVFEEDIMGPADGQVLSRAFDQTLRSLQLRNPDEAICKIVARKIIEIGATGIRDPEEISNRAIKELGPS
jgi:hypothetical protein